MAICQLQGRKKCLCPTKILRAPLHPNNKMVVGLYKEHDNVNAFEIKKKKLKTAIT